MKGMLPALSFSLLILLAPALSASEPEPDLVDSIADLPSIAELFEQQRRHVISVQTELAGPPGDLPPMFDGFNDEPIRGEGSGFLVDDQGLAVTNWHVVARAQSIEAITYDGVTHRARLVGADPTTDIALIQVEDLEGYEPAELGATDDISVGEWVVAIGSPFGLEQSVTLGVLSATGREIGMGPYDDFLQTDASINPGNSGGPLFNLNGEVIGVNTAIIPFGGNIGFAVPIDTVRRLMPELQEHGWVKRGFIGAGVQDLTHALAETFDLDPDAGVLVRSVDEGDPADDAGLTEGDIITHVGDQRTEESSELLRIIAQLEPGEETTVRFLRDGDEQETTLQAGERPDPDREEVEQTLDPEPIEPGRLGVVLRSVSADMAQRRDLPDATGVYVDRIEPGSPASGVLETGDIILRVGDQEITSPEEVPDVLRDQPRDRPIRLLLNRQGEPHFVAVELASGD